MTPENSGELMGHVTTGAMVVYFIEALKKSGRVNWLTLDTKTLNTITSMLMAAIAAIGISYSYDPALDGGTLVLRHISAGAIGAAFWEWCKQFAVQQLIFDGIVAPKTTAKQLDVQQKFDRQPVLEKESSNGQR